MNGKTETKKAPMTNALLLLLAAAVLIAAFVAYYSFNDVLLPLRFVGLLAGIGISALIAGQSDRGKSFFKFVKEADVERRKVVWPTRQEALQTTLIVIVLTIIISLILSAIDWGLGKAVRALLGGG